MDPVRFSRLRRLSRDELRHRLGVAARRQRQRLGVMLGRTEWNRGAIRRVILPGLLDADVLDALARGDWATVNAGLRGLVDRRPSRFVIDPHAPTALRRAIVARWPDAIVDAAERGNAILEGRHDLLGYAALSFARDGRLTDWHFDPVHGRVAPMRFFADVPYLDPAVGDHKVIWELNRQQYLLALTRAWWLTGDPRYRDAMAEAIPAWMAANPPLLGINWASSLELAFRSLSWLWALHGLAGAAAPDDASGWLVDLLVGLDRQLTQVEHNLSRYFSPNTHLTGEALALYVAGTALPELAASARWIDTGREVLLGELDRQVMRDGGHAERSTHYHRYTLDFYLLALVAAERLGDVDAARVFREAVERLAIFMQALVDDRGRMPQIGDDDGGMLWPMAGRDPRDVRDSLGLAAALIDRPGLAPWGIPEEAFWIGWSARPQAFADAPLTVHDRRTLAPAVHTNAFQETGFVAARNGHGDHLVFDVGPHGYLNGGHAHADALSMTLAIDAAPLLVDPGTAAYTIDPDLRDRMRSTALHNTLLLDGRPSAVGAGPFHWHSRADARLASARHNQGFLWAEAYHDGYAPARHRRSIVHTLGSGWLVVDEATAPVPQRATLHWHFAPSWHVSSERDGQISATDDEGRHAWLMHDGGDVALAYGDDDLGLGWCSPRYGTLVPTSTVRITRSGVGPLSMISWIGSAGPLEPAPMLERLDVDADRDVPALAVAVTRGRQVAATLLRPGDTPDRDTRSSAFGDYHTDARFLQSITRGPVPVSLSIADGTHATALSDRWLSVAADERMTGLHVAFEATRLDLWSTTPPAHLYLHGAALDAVRCVRMNGRDLRVDSVSHDSGITIARGDWRAGAVHEHTAPSYVEAGL